MILGPRCQGAGCRNRPEQGEPLCRGCRALEEAREVRMAHWAEGRRLGRLEVLGDLRDLGSKYTTSVPRHAVMMLVKEWERAVDRG